MREIILVVGAVVTVGALVYAVLHYVARSQPDTTIHAAIEGNRYHYRKGMKKPDHEKLSLIGKQRWSDVSAAQERHRQREKVAHIVDRKRA